MKFIEGADTAVGTYLSVVGGHATVEQVLNHTLDRISSLEPRLRAWQILDPELAKAQAIGIDRRIRAGETIGTMAGVPLGIKDIFDTADMPTAYGSPIYSGQRPKADAFTVSKVKEQGGVLVGKTVTTEFAYFAPGPTANPWNIEHTPGGSSSGSAAAVASGMVPLAFGSQTAGSLIRPASYCGVFALKPTFGLVSLQGVKPFSESLDTMGWLARTADDLELMRCALTDAKFSPLNRLDIRGVRLAASLTHEEPFLTPAGRETWIAGVESLRRRCPELPDIQIPPSLSGLFEAQKCIMAWEASKSLSAELRNSREQLSPAIIALLEAGSAMPESMYLDAQKLAAFGRQQLEHLMRELDALIIPSAPGEAPVGLDATGDPAFARVWTLLGLPCVNVPGLFGPSGLPVGMQLVGHRGQERRLLEVASAVHNVIR